MATSLLAHSDRPPTSWRLDQQPDARSEIQPKVTSSPMASPSRQGERDDNSHKPRLPSFSNFLSGAGRPNLDFAEQSSNPPSLGSTRSSFADVRSLSSSGEQGLPPANLFHRSPDPRLYSPEQRARGSISGFGLSDPRRHAQSATTLSGGFPPSELISSSSPTNRPSGQAAPSESSHTRVVVGERHVPGKGVCYLYDDGSTCQKIINGDTVNPKWGTTKAGKPRKRLGQACNTCREKKIKCDPSVPKCAQCQKFGRECKFETAPRTNHKSPQSQSSGNSPGTPGPMQERSFERTNSTVSDDIIASQVPSFSNSGSRSSLTVENLLSPFSMEISPIEDDSRDSGHPAKRARFSDSSRDSVEGRNNIVAVMTRDRTGNSEDPGTLDNSNFAWSSDPHEVDSGLTDLYLGKYFTHVNAATYCMLPRKLFMQWVKNNRTKSSWDKLLLYTMLAMGTLFLKGEGSASHRKLFARLAEEALGQSTGVFELQIVQARLVLSLFHFALGECSTAWELCGAAVRAACGMKLNTEDSSDTHRGEHRPLFDLDAATTAECRRRTFWCAYIMDCFNGCCAAYVTSIQSSDCLLRLPCPEAQYEAGEIPKMPIFDESQFGLLRAHRECLELGAMAYLVQIATIFNGITMRITRSQVQLADEYDVSYEKSYQDIKSQLNRWDKALVRQFNLAPSTSPNAEESKAKRKASGLHIIYHYSAMLQHRHIRYEHVKSHTQVRNVKEAYNHARRTLELMRELSTGEPTNVPHHKFAMSSPLTGYAMITAIDIITAAGAVSDLLENRNSTIELLSEGIEALDGLAEHWDSAKQQRDLVKDRIGILLSATKSSTSSRKKAFFVDEALSSPFSRDQDLIYGLPRLQYLQALGWESLTDPADLFEVGAHSHSSSGHG